MIRTRTSIAVVLLLLALIALGGAILRFHMLETHAMGADVMEYYKICQQGVAPSELMMNSEKYLGRMPPLWFAAHNAFLQTFHIPVSFRSVRIPDAIIGVFTILAAFLLGREVKDDRTGLLAAFFIALQPLHVQLSRECYFYAPIILGCILGLWSVLRICCDVSKGKRPAILSYIAFAFSLFLVTHIQISSWAYAVVMVCALYVSFVYGAVKKNTSWAPTIVLTLICVAIGVPTLMGEWGMGDVMHLMFGEGKEQWGNVFDAEKENTFVAGWAVVSSFLFGRGWLRSTLDVLVLIGGVVAIVRGWKHSVRLRVFSWFALGAIALLTVIHTMSVFPPTPRHYSSLLPILLVLFPLAIVLLADWLIRVVKKPQVAFMLPVGGGLLLVASLNGWASYLATQLTGQPPYTEVTQWVDANLPSGTVILCDRWFTPWNEFRINAATNVSFTYTVPNEPVQAYVQNKWRDTAIQFFEANPGAAFYEGKEYWDQLGPWEWPHRYFANREIFYDKAGMALDAMGLHYRPLRTGYPREWIPVTIYYNTTEDILRRAVAENKQSLVLFGKGWDYTKTQDGRDWRVFMQNAEVNVHNLTDEPQTVALVLTGTSVQQQGVPGNGVKSIMTADGKSCTFQPNRIQRVSLGPIVLKLGENVISCSSVGAAGQNVPLLISHIDVQEPGEK